VQPRMNSGACFQLLYSAVLQPYPWWKVGSGYDKIPCSCGNLSSSNEQSPLLTYTLPKYEKNYTH
jgi:hypothetical protein